MPQTERAGLGAQFVVHMPWAYDRRVPDEGLGLRAYAAVRRAYAAGLRARGAHQGLIMLNTSVKAIAIETHVTCVPGYGQGSILSMWGFASQSGAGDGA